MAIIDTLKIIDDKYLITAGIDSKIRIWNPDQEKMIAKFEAHDYSVLHMVCLKEHIFSYGYDMKLKKFKFKTKQLENTVDIEHSITAMKLIKSVDD